MAMHNIFLVLSAATFLFALVIAVLTRRSKLSGYSEIAKDVERVSRMLLQSETFRDGSDLVIKGNHGPWPVLVRFSSGEGASGLSITVHAPANFQMVVAPVSAPKPETGTRVRTGDGLFDFKFSTISEQPMVARMFVSAAGTVPLIKKLCWASFTSLRIGPGELELLVRPCNIANIFDYLQQHLETMEKLAGELRAMPGADAIRIVPFRKPGNRMLKPAIAAALAIAFLEAWHLSATSPAQEQVFASQPGTQEDMLPADAAGILYLKGWRVAQDSDFDANEMAWLRTQGANPGGTLHGDFSGGNAGRDTTYILAGDDGMKRVVVVSEGKLIYDRRYRQIFAAAKVPAGELNAIEWRDPLPAKPDGDGLLIVTKPGDPTANLILAFKDGSLMLGAPVNYQELAF
jgi:hypothetical protein